MGLVFAAICLLTNRNLLFEGDSLSFCGFSTLKYYDNF